MFKQIAIHMILIAALSGCAAELTLTPAHLNQANESQRKEMFTLSEDVNIKLASGYSRKLKKGTKWQFIGTIGQEHIFKPVDTIFTIEGAHVHEAYLAINDNSVVGFYAPGENAYFPLESSMSLPIHMEGN